LSAKKKIFFEKKRRSYTRKIKKYNEAISLEHKTFILDTNVLLHDPESFLQFPNSKVIIPLTVLEELDRMKKLPNELGKNARTVFRHLVQISQEDQGSFSTGIHLPNGATIVVHLSNEGKHPSHFPLSSCDNQIISTAWSIKEEGEPVIFVSKDFAARIKAEALGIESKDYENLKFSFEGLYKGYREVDVENEVISRFLHEEQLSIDSLLPKEKEKKKAPKANEYFILSASENPIKAGKYSLKENKLIPLLKVPNLWRIKPKNIIQACAVDLLLRDDIKLVTLTGQAGTGKTLLALACGMRKVFDEGVYNKILISRPIMPLGRDIGYLPGTKEEKLFHWMQPIYDNLEFLCNCSGNEGSETLQWVMDSKKIELEAVTYIRGRSLPKMYIIVDEAQNLTPHEVKTIISRAGEDTKVILTGDPTQIDNPYLDKDSNALTYVIGKFAEESIYGQMYLAKTERSELAAIATELL
jgi:PhoH-like ATPase